MKCNAATLTLSAMLTLVAPAILSSCDDGGDHTFYSQTGGGGETTPECTVSTQCAFDELCHGGACEAAFNREYRVTVLEAWTQTSKPDGSSWDVGGGAPDLVVEFGILEGKQCRTTVALDVFSNVWEASCDFVIRSGDVFAFGVADEDMAEYDLILAYALESDDDLVRFVRDSGVPRSVWNSYSELYFRVDPLF